jgi:hypothetical protein
VTKANYDGLERRLALNGAAVLFLNRDAENKAVFATTPEEREVHIAGIMRRLDGQLVTGALTKDQYKAAVKDSLTNIAMGDVLREVQGAVQEQNPEREQVVIDTLARGGHPNLAVDTQLRLAETLTNRRDARVREQDRLAEKNERALAKAAEAERELVTDGYDERAARGDLSHEELNQAVRDRVIRPDDARRIRKSIYDFQGDAAKASAAASVAGGKTDDAVYNRIELDILSRSRPVSRQEIRALQQNGKLAASGPRSAASLLKMVEDAALAAEGTGKDITKHPMFDQGLDDIKTLRMGKGIMSDLTDAEALRLRNAVREYHDIARSGKFTPSQLPEVARKIVDRALSERSPLERPALPATAAQQLRYRNPTDLAAAKKAGLIPDAEFNRQVDLMIEAGIIPKPGAPAPGAAPTPSTSEAARGGRR